eukprot:CAMPEP_0170188786 /NCGR_PEP_ID=MMETSP0040_2-20121228/45204_1 /TAXON_ID=641309 /ORGANISM="Lotharella oceanica, Strain CCMP622" /LENGTH=79 /DNA_ID=CAMNT_0010436165 /DNA_START=229 /DNA_END=464 /DNA_ORIENTATION=+
MVHAAQLILRMLFCQSGLALCALHAPVGRAHHLRELFRAQLRCFPPLPSTAAYTTHVFPLVLARAGRALPAHTSPQIAL